MVKDRKSTNSEFVQAIHSNRFRRFTLVIPISLDQNLEAYALKVGRAKSDIIREILVDFLTQEGFQPDKTPKIEISY